MDAPATRKKRGTNTRREARDAYLFLAPSILGFIFFVLLPFFIIIYISFTKYNVITPPQLNEYKNWIKLTMDKRFVTTLLNSFKYIVLLVPMHMVVSLLLALGLTSVRNRLGVYALRTVYYFPTLIATASIAMVWIHFFNKDYGLLNYFIGLFGAEPIAWLKSSFWVYPATMIFSLWKFVGVYFLYFFIGLQGIDATYVESAQIDGANAWQQIRHIKLPLLTPTIFFVFVTQMIGTIQIFDEPFMLTSGGPGDASRSISQYIYDTAYTAHNFGYASAVALVLLVIVLIITLIQFRGSSWVNYDR